MPTLLSRTDYNPHVSGSIGLMFIIPYKHQSAESDFMFMKQFIILLLLLFSTLSLFAQTTYRVGSPTWYPGITYDFTNINDAIIESAHGDTIIVYPCGTLGAYEQVNFAGKNVYVTSLYKYTGNRNDIYNTKISYSPDSCVLFINGEGSGAVLNGFSIQGGSGTSTGTPQNPQREGGGIFIRNASPSILNCVIKNNTASTGGGISIQSSGPVTSPYLAGNVIKNNSSSRQGGGLSIPSANRTIQVIFDPINKNSIFSNNAPNYKDIFSYSRAYINVVLDTFTVAIRDPYYIYMVSSYDFSCDHWIIEQVNQDIYVSVTGNDNNSGLSELTPLKTIREAMFRVKSNPDNRNTIHVAPGIYATSQGQILPIMIKSDVILQGAGSETTTIDLEFNVMSTIGASAIESDAGAKNYKISGFTFSNGRMIPLLTNITAPIMLAGTDDSEISDCRFENNVSGIQTLDLGVVSRTEPLLLKDIAFVNNFNNIIDVRLENGIFENIKILFHSIIDFNYTTQGFGTPIRLSTNRDVRANYTISNILIANTSYTGSIVFTQPDLSVVYGALSMRIYENVDVLINNATIVFNQLTEKDQPFFSHSVMDIYANSEVRMVNSIISNNNGFYIIVSDASTIYIDHSLIAGGRGMILYNHVWGEGNIDGYPGFDWNYPGWEEWPFQLGADSPCIDTGTANIPNYTWLPVDLLRNTRIIGGTVDMGAYEFNGSSDFYVNFEGEPRTGDIPLRVQFTDTSVGYEITSWQWDFNNDGVFDSTEQNPSFTYYTTGQTTVRLVVNNGQGSCVKPEYINPRPVAITGGTLQGVVTAGGFPLPDVLVTVVGTTLNATTNEMGTYSITSIVAGIYSIRAEKIEYESSTHDGVVINIDEVTTHHFVLSPVSESENTIVPQETKLNGNYPNPFNPETTISFSLQNDSAVSLKVYNVKGQRIKTLVNGMQSQGNHKVVWNGKDENDHPVSSGIYFYQMENEGFVCVKKMVLVK